MREIKLVKPNVSQEDLMYVMSLASAGTYTTQKVYNLMTAYGHEMTLASVRNHLGKVDKMGAITKVKAGGLVAFAFYDDTYGKWKIQDMKREKLTAINRANMQRYNGKANIRKNKLAWGAKIIGKPGTKVTMMGA